MKLPKILNSYQNILHYLEKDRQNHSALKNFVARTYLVFQKKSTINVCHLGSFIYQM